MLSVGKLLRLAKTKAGRVVLSQIDESKLMANLGNLLIGAGVDETKALAIVNFLAAMRPEGGYKSLLLEEGALDDLQEVIDILVEPDVEQLQNERI